MDTIEQLRRQIEEIQVPPLPTQAEQDQIMKGRKGQADIDAGRRAIQERIKANQDAITLRSTLTTQLSGLEEKAGQRKKEEEAASPEAQRNKALMTLGPSAFGYGAGYGGGALISRSQGATETDRNVQRRSTAETGPRAARMESANKGGLIPRSSATARGLSRFAPFGAGAAFFGGDAAAMQYMMDKADTQGEKDIYGVSRNLLGGTAAGMAHSGLEATFNPKVIPDAASLSKILAPDPAPTPIAGQTAPSAPLASSFKSGVEARAYAKKKGVNLPTKLTAAEAIARADQLKAAADVAQEGSRASKLIGKAGKVGIPLAAGALAYDAASSEAEAAGASPTDAKTRGAVAGTGTGAATAGSAYGLTKALQAAPNLGRALGIGGGMTMPLAAMEIGPGTPEAANLERSRIAQNWPRIASMLGLTDEMGQQLPERNTGKTDEFATARSLQIPQGVPLPNPDGSSPYPEMAPMGAGPMMPQQPQMPMRRPQLPYAAMGFGGRF